VTIKIISGAPNQETRNAELFKEALLKSEPRLDHVDITADIICGLPIPGRQIDLLLLYHDARSKERQLRTPNGAPIHSFVLVVEVKNHSPDLIQFDGPTVHVRYDLLWHDATDQCDQQMYALKRYQSSNYKGPHRREATFVQRAIWLARADASAFDGTPAQSSVPVHFADLSWEKLVSSFQLNRKEVRTLVDQSGDPKYHDMVSLRASLLHKVRPTLLDRRRLNALTKTRFDAEKTQYIQNLGKGLLRLKGRAGTGKTFSLLQIAIHLAQKGQRTEVITYNHGLIADISRALRLLQEQDPTIDPLPVLKTRYKFIQDAFKQTFGHRAERYAIEKIPVIEDRENFRVKALLDPEVFFKERSDICPIALRKVQLPDYVLIDEGQDWKEDQRDFMFSLMGPERIIVADGIDQFVGQDRCDWYPGNIPKNWDQKLQQSVRTRAATCQTVSEIASELGIEWDVKTSKDIPGGRFTVLVEPNARRAVQRGLEILEADQRVAGEVKAIDQLICLPSNAVGGPNYANLFDAATDEAERDSWRGFDEDDRRIYPVRDGQLRAVRYESCRGMEGWTTLCLGMDLFYDQRVAEPLVDEVSLQAALKQTMKDKYSDAMFAERLEQAEREYAFHWLMIPLTRSIDHLVVHLHDENSKLGQILNAVSVRCLDQIEWVRPEAPSN
jgi:hypothetical protein